MRISTGTRVSVRELRAHLKNYLEGAKAVPVGDFWKLRAIVVPIPEFSSWDERAKRRALKAAHYQFRQVITRELQGDH